jgi:hypothetical protein
VSRAELSALRALVSVDGERRLAAASGARLDRAALEGHGLAKREIDELLAKLAPATTVPTSSSTWRPRAPPNTSPNASPPPSPAAKSPRRSSRFRAEGAVL